MSLHRLEFVSMSARRALLGQPKFICRSCVRQSQSRLRRTYATTTANDVYDVVCVGGGPAGLSLLTALRTIFKHQ